MGIVRVVQIFARYYVVAVDPAMALAMRAQLRLRRSVHGIDALHGFRVVRRARRFGVPFDRLIDQRQRDGAQGEAAETDDRAVDAVSRYQIGNDLRENYGSQSGSGPRDSGGDATLFLEVGVQCERVGRLVDAGSGALITAEESKNVI